VAVALFATFPTYWHDFVWDDVHLIHKSEAIRSGVSAWQVWRPSYWRTRHFAKGATYRPVPETWFAACYAYRGADARVFHATNILLHMLVCAGVLVAGRLAFAGCGPALAIALLFALHPVHVETSAWAKNAAVLWATLFSLAAFVLYVHSVRWWPKRRLTSIASLLAGLVCYGLAAASMEMGVLVAGVIVVWAVIGERRPSVRRAGVPAAKQTADHSPRAPLCRDREMRGAGRPRAGQGPSRSSRARSIALSAPFALSGIAALCFFAWLGSGTDSGSADHALLSRALTSLAVLGRYCSCLLMPLHLNPEHSLGSIAGWATLGVGVLVCAATCWWRWQAARMAILWTFMGAAPFCIVSHLADRPFAEQRVYFALIGACAFISLGLVRLPRRRGRFLWGLTAVALASLTVSQGFRWRSEASLWNSTVPRSPAPARPWFNLSTVQADAHRLDAAERSAQMALRRRPSYAQAHDRLGRLDRMRGDYRAAVQHFRAATEADPRFGYAWNNLGITLTELGQVEEGMRALTEAVRVNPSYRQALLNRGQLYGRMGEPEKAIADLTASLGLTPAEDARTHYKLGDQYRRCDRMAKARQHYRAAIRLDSGYGAAYAQLAGVHYQQGRLTEAVGNYSISLRIERDRPEVWLGFGSALADLGLKRKAVVHLKEAIRRSPELGSRYGASRLIRLLEAR